jgi:hypothetical protein
MPFSNPVTPASVIEAQGVEIAQAIQEAGISLLGAPALLYNNSAIQPAGTPGLVGATISNSWFPSGTTEAQAITDFNTYVGLPLGNQVQRVYYGQLPNGNGIWPANLSGQPVAAIIATGAKLQVCIKPALAGLTNATLAASEQQNILNTIALLNAANVNFDIVLYTEPNIGGHFTSAAQFIAYWALYAPTIRGATCTATGENVKCIYNPASYGNNSAEYYPGDAAVDVVSLDYYGTDWKAGITPDDAAALADNHLPDPIPFGISEWNAVTSESDTITTAQYNSFATSLINFMYARLAAGKDNWDVIGYFGINVQSSPLNQINSSSDFKVPANQNAYNDLTVAPPATPGIVIPASDSKTIPPITPSPVGGYAIANGISYDITVTLESNTTGSTVPFVILQVNWFNIDMAGAQAVATKHWILPIGENGSAGTVITGAGPQHGQFWELKAVNEDTEPCTLIIQANTTSRTVADDAWYWDAAQSVNVPGYTEPNATPVFTGCLCSLDEVSIPGNGSKSYLMSLFDGEVYVSFSSGTGGDLTFQIIPQPVSLTTGSAIYNQTTASDSRTVILPRAPCLLTILNPNSSAVNAYAQVIALD